MICCSTCSLSIGPDDDYAMYNCEHAFHRNCILKTKISILHPNCPTCKAGKMYVNKYKDDINHAILRKVSDEPKIKKQHAACINDAYTQFASNVVYSRFATNESDTWNSDTMTSDTRISDTLNDEDTKKLLLFYFPSVDISISQRYKIFMIIFIVMVVAIFCFI